MRAGEADPDLLIPIGLALLSLRQAIAATGDARLAMQYLLFGLDVNDPQVTPALVEEGVPESVAPALESYVGRKLRPWLRQIDGGGERASRWAEEALARLSAAARSHPSARAWAERTLAEGRRAVSAARLDAWRHALMERTWPADEAVPLLAAIGILQEGFGLAVRLSGEEG